MLDRRKIIIFTIIGGIVAAAIIVVIVLVVTNQPGAPRPTEASSSSTPSTIASPDDEAAQAIQTFKTSYLGMARNAAVIASSWNGATDHEAMKARYAQAGFSKGLAESFKPVWADIFGDNITAEITTTVDNNLTVSEVHGEEGSYVWLVGATVTFKGTWNENGSARAQSARTAIWWLTIDQATKTVTAIDQPTPEELRINVNKGK